MERAFMSDRTGSFMVRPVKMAYAVGIFMIGAGVLLMILEGMYHIGRIPFWVYLVILAIILMGVSVCLEAKNRRLLVEEDCMYYRNMFGRVRQFEGKDIGYVKAADDFSKGRDYLKLYDKEGKLLCRLECGMYHAQELIAYLYDKGIPFEIEKGNRKSEFLAELMKQQVIASGERRKISKQVYEQTKQSVHDWQIENRELGADFVYGFVEESEDKCYLEIYVKKENCLVRDRKGQLLMIKFPIFYKRSTGVMGEAKRLYYNEGWQEEMETAIHALADYLPRHRFCQEDETRKIELKEWI